MAILSFLYIIGSAGLLAALVPGVAAAVGVGAGGGGGGGTITNCGSETGAGSIAAAFSSGGGTWTFACTANATIDLSTPLAVASGETITIENPTSETVTLDGLGGEMFAMQGGTLTLQGQAVGGGSNLTLTDGGGTALPAIDLLSGDVNTLTLNDVAMTDSNAPAGEAPIAALDSGDNVTIASSTFTGNHGDNGGVVDNAGGTLTVRGSTFTGNYADHHYTSFQNAAVDAGGAIFSTGTLTITGSTFDGNQATDTYIGPDEPYAGGAIYVGAGSASVTDSTFDSNEALSGGAIFADISTTSLSVAGSTFSGNGASQSGVSPSFGEADEGGAIFASGDSFSLYNSTLYHNTAGAAGTEGEGGGLYLGSALTTAGVDSVTFDGNTAAGNTGTPNGDNLYWSNAGMTALTVDGDLFDDVQANNCATLGFGKSTAIAVDNLVYPGVTCETAFGGTGWVTGNPLLGSLAYNNNPNGSGTDTVALGQGSPAIGSGDGGTCHGSPDNGVDQRGALRSNLLCDIGAYQTEPSITLTANPSTITAGGSSTVSGVVYRAPGLGLASVTVDLSLPTGPGTLAQTAVTTGPDGSFQTTYEAPASALSSTLVAVDAALAPAETQYYGSLSASTDVTVIPNPAGLTIAAAPSSVEVNTTTTVTGVVFGASQTPLANERVDLTTSAGSLSPTTTTTNSQGQYTTMLTAPAVAAVVTVTGTVYGTTYSASTSVVVAAPVPAPERITIAAVPSTVLVGATSTVSGEVYGAGQTPLANEQVYLSTSAGSVSPASVTTDGAGQYSTTFTAPGTPQTVTVTGSVYGTVYSASTTIVVTVGGGGGGGGGGGYVAPPTPTSPCGTLTLPQGSPLSVSSATSGPPDGLAPDARAASCVFSLTGSRPSQPETVTIGYDTGVLGTLAPERLSVFRLRTGGIWTFLPTAVDAQAGTVSADVQGPETLVVLADIQKMPDVPQGYWAKAAIDTAAGAELVDGFPPAFSGPYDPNGTITRAQAIKMIVLAAQLVPASGPTPFRDVAPGDWFAPYVAAGYAAGIVRGETPTTLQPHAPVTREAFAVLLARALHLTGTARLHFTDASLIAPWAVRAVEAVVAAGYFDGFPGGTLQPQQPLTRAQAAYVMAKVVAGEAPVAQS